ncbi:hypothetical protein LOD99_2318 [Oopsacas minuta]|uniref:Protein kinase domain-containing protein n=1 Tax=Oopsacas minuta TaxID=111878 RepID=A0AAV7K2U0_9METZ|nr:hypothetical protein LOD99_2318 [Oopsacas minuta]
MAFEALMEAMIATANVPDNYLVLQSELDWMKLYKAASDKNAIICIEFYDESFSACRGASQHFLQLARKYSNLPFIQIRLTPICKWALVRKSVGGVDYVPCIVVMSFTNDGAERAKFEGEREIEQALRRGLIQNVINEFKERRETANLEELIAGEVLKKLVADNIEKEEEVQGLRKRMDDIESSRAKEEQKKERMRLAVEERERTAIEERRVNRPIILNELKHQDDIESLGVGRLKDVFKRLHVNIVGFTEKHELLAKLYDEFPELRKRQRNVYEAYSGNVQSSLPPTSVDQIPVPDEDNIYALSDQDIEKLPVTKLKKYISKYGLESEGPFSERSELIQAIKKKRATACRSRPSSVLQAQNSFQVKEEVNELNGKIMDLTDKLTQTKILSICRLSHFVIVQTHQLPASDKICQHTVRCKKEGLPDSNKLYTMKGVFNYFDCMLDSHSVRIINEFEILSTLEPHPNIVYHCALIYDKPTPSYVCSPKVSLDNIALFSVSESLPYSICTYLGRNHKNAAIETKRYVDWMKQVISAFSYLFDKNVFLRSIKHDNIMYDPEMNLIKLMGFDSAITSQTVPFYTELTSIGDLNSYLAPEILNAIPGPSNFLDYTSHYSWTAGALSYDLACNPSPFTSDRVDPSQYNNHEIPTLNCIYPYGSLNKSTSSPIPPMYASLVIRMLSYRPNDRPDLQAILSTIDTVITSC